jgi:hypothetical protein
MEFADFSICLGFGGIPDLSRVSINLFKAASYSVFNFRPFGARENKDFPP